MRFAGLTLLAVLASAPAARGQEFTKDEYLLAVQDKLKAANETAGPSVACVVVSRSEKYPKPSPDTPGALGGFDRELFAKTNPQTKPDTYDLSKVENVADHGFACGVVIDDKGLVLTPYHVIAGATKIYVHLPNRQGAYADIHAADARSDLAVLKLLAPPGAKAIKFADVRLPGREKPTVVSGNLVVLMANAYIPNLGVNKPSAALGSIAAVYPHVDPPAVKDQPFVKQRWPRPSDSYYYHGPLLAHDAKLNASISGAALLNLNGELIGLTTTAPVLGSGEKAPDYALPMDDGVRRVIEVLKRGEEVEYGYLGVTLLTERDGNFNPNVVQIQSVVPLGPTAQAGILDGDIITHVNGVRIGKYEELLTQIGSGLAGSKVALTIQRNRNRMGEVTVTLGKLRHGQASIVSVRPEPVFGLRVDHGSVLAQQDGNANIQILAEGIPLGVSVFEVAPGSPAAGAFKKLGDDPKRWLITHVNGTAIANPGEFYTAAKGQKAVKLTVLDPTEPRAKRQPREVSFP